MAPRSPSIALALVLATIALPPAAAIGEEVYAIVGDVVATAERTVADVTTIVIPPAEPEPSPGEETHGEHGSHSHSEGSHAHAEPRQAPPAEERRDAGLLAPVARLVPVPFIDVGAAPRIDLGAFTSVVVPLASDTGAAPVRGARIAAPPTAATPPPAESPEAEALAPAALALGATAAATAAAPAAAGALWERLRRFAWIALLYSRIAKERLLDHTSRERLLDAIRARPGLAVADLAEATGAPRNTVTYHLRVLEREGLVSSTRNGRNRLFFAPGSLPQKGNADALATLRHETTLAIARLIGETPGVDQKALCARVGLSPSLAHWHADRLVATGLVDKRREGRSVRYYPGASYALVDARAA